MKLDHTHPGRKYLMYATRKRDMETMHLPYPRDWTRENFNLPPNWKEIVLAKLDELRQSIANFNCSLTFA